MNQLLLGRRLGAVASPAFQKFQHERLVRSLEPGNLRFTCRPPATSLDASGDAPGGARTPGSAQQELTAHTAGVNVLTLDTNDGRYMVTGGADSTVRLWDLEQHEGEKHSPILHPAASMIRSTPASHTHALTSISIYPFDPVPSTILSSAYDKTLKLTSITPTALVPVHTFPLDFVPFTHALSPIASSSPLIAVGSAHPAIKLVDLRSGLSTHSLPGHNGAVYSIAWSPSQSHVLASGSVDGRVLFFDIRRSQSSFGSLDLDDAIGVISPDHTPDYAGRRPLDWNTRAHGGPVTGVRWTALGDKLVTAGHDQRIRVWDAATGRNDLVHFGPRIRNERNGEFAPLISPTGSGQAGRETLFWPNDDGKGEIFMFNMREGNMLGSLKTPGTARGPAQARPGGVGVGRLNSRGRINTLAWRVNANSGAGVEMYSGHADGSIQCWVAAPSEDKESADTEEATGPAGGDGKKRKRDLVGDLVEGLTKRPVTRN